MNPKLLISDIAPILDVSIPSVHAKIKSNKIQPLKHGNKHYISHDHARDLFKFEFNPKVVSFQIVKGGAGKTTLAFSVALSANLLGARVLCIDLDQQSNLTRSFGFRNKAEKIFYDIVSDTCSIDDAIVNVIPGLDIIPSSIKTAILDKQILAYGSNLEKVYSRIVSPLKKKYDMIIFDCPPAIGHSVASAALASDTVVCPVMPDDYYVDGLELTFEEIKKINEDYNKNIKIQVLLNKIDERFVLSNKIPAAILNNPKYENCIMPCFVRTSQEFSNAIEKGVSIFESSRKTAIKNDIHELTLLLAGLK